MNLLRKLFFPFVPVYYVVTSLRNKLYDWNVLKSKSFPLPIICVGNLSVGGTGKSPMIEYLIKLLKDNYKMATLSRGYKRNTSGFRLAESGVCVNEIGDEPFQFKKKFNDILVAVDEDRQHGIETLLELESTPEVILLDDAFQHRKVTAGLNVLLTTYDNLYVDDCLLPTGDLRESKKGANRAELIVVTKCPSELDKIEKDRIQKTLKLEEHQKLFFSSIAYDDFICNDLDKLQVESLMGKELTLVTGIANPDPLVEYLKLLGLQFEHLRFKDHYNFTQNDIDTFKKKKFLLTSEKDFVRLSNNLESQKLYYLPITVKIDREDEFNSLITKFVASF